MSTHKTTKSELKELRETQMGQIKEAIKSLAALSAELRQRQQTLDLLQSVSEGLYEEIDKLAKKSPADQISTMVLGQVNDVIRESKELLPDDPFMKRYVEFVAAGDNPEHRDVVVVLRQIRQGLQRFELQLSERRNRTGELLSDAGGIRIALQFFLQGHEVVSMGDLSANKVSVSGYWKEGTFEHDFNFVQLDRTDIPVFFQKPE